MEATYFESESDFRSWLKEHHANTPDLWVGYFKVKSREASISYKESVDVALSYGWIDGRRQSIDDERYRIRFTPRKPKSIWSQVNLKRFEELRHAGLIEPAGLATFESRDHSMVKKYSFENEEQHFDEEMTSRFQAHEEAWAYFTSEAKSYQRVAKWWVLSAKRAETRASRFQQLIESSATRERLHHLNSWKSKPKDGKNSP